MNRRNSTTILAIAACALLATPSLAGAPEQVKARIAGLKQLGADFKSVMDGTRASDIAKVRQASNRIVTATRGIYGWFPAGSGPQPGIKTAAKPDIWRRAAEFRAAQDVFARQAIAFQQVAAAGNFDQIRSQSRKLGASCKSCHDSFRVPSD